MKKNLLLLAVFLSNAMISSAQTISHKDLKCKEASSTVICSEAGIKAKKSDFKVLPVVNSVKKLKTGVFLNGNVKVLQSKKVSNNLEVQVVEDSKGRISKRISGNKETDRILPSNHSMLQNKVEARAAKSNTLFESFEGYDGKTPDWLPTTWTEIVSEGNAPTEKANFTWYVAKDNGNLVTPSDGNYQAVIYFAHNDQMVGLPQDEWLISPSFTPKANEKLYFDLAFAPIFIYNLEYFDFTSITFSKREVSATLKVLISVEGGNWTTIFDVANIANQISDQDLYDYFTDISYYTFSQKLSEYAGKSIKIAFQYVGAGGNAMALDAIRVGVPSPTALYRRPQGYFYKGFDKNYSSSTAITIFGPAYEDAQWINCSNSDAEKFEWSFIDPENIREGGIVTTEDRNPIIQYPWASVSTPTLTSKAEGAEDVSYSQISSTESKSGIVYTGGDNIIDFSDGSSIVTGVGNYEHSLGISTAIFDENQYCFGTGSESIWEAKVDAIANFFEKPIHKYWFDEFWISLAEFDADIDAEFTLIIHRVNEENVLADTIATATCYTSEVEKNNINIYNMPFKFKRIDPETGREEDTYLEIEDAIAVELKGINSSKVRTFAPLQQKVNSPVNENNSYFYLVTEENGKMKRTFHAASNMLRDVYTSFIFNMNATFSFLFTEDPTYNAPTNGGTKTFSMTSCYNPNGWWIEVETPDWIEIAAPAEGSLDFTVVVKPLTNNEIRGRSFDFTLKTWGAEQKFHITQGDVTGIETVEANPIKVITNGDHFDLSYPEGINNVTVINTTGQTLASYKLPASGKYTMNTANLNKGIYILKFNNNKSIKVIK